MIPVIVAELLDTLAHDIPDLHGAACRGHPQLFDVADRHDTQAITADTNSSDRPDCITLQAGCLPSASVGP